MIQAVRKLHRGAAHARGAAGGAGLVRACRGPPRLAHRHDTQQQEQGEIHHQREACVGAPVCEEDSQVAAADRP